MDVSFTLQSACCNGPRKRLHNCSKSTGYSRGKHIIQSCNRFVFQAKRITQFWSKELKSQMISNRELRYVHAEKEASPLFTSAAEEVKIIG